MRITCLAAALTVACGGSSGGAPDAAPGGDAADSATFEFPFGEGTHGFEGAFADYPVGMESFYELDSGGRTLPAPLSGGSFLIEGNNHSDDLFMYMFRRVDGLAPATTYQLTGSVELASNAGTGCVGVGGAPGESVTTKLGATTAKPENVVDGGSHYRTVFDKGDQSSGGTAMAAIGDLANGTTDCSGNTWRMKTVTLSSPLAITTDGSGGAWVVFGTDSGFEGLSTVHVTVARFAFAR